MNQAVARIDARTDHGSDGRPALRPALAPNLRRKRWVRPHVVVGTLLKAAAHIAWHGFQAVNTRLPYGVKQPKWAPAPLMKSKDRTFPQLGFPRETDSLCPQCVKEVRESIVQGESDWRVLIEGKPGEIKARIVERNDQIWMEKDCPRHGHFEDLMAIDAEFLRRMERL
jgi:tetraether lipid synthase